MTAAQTQDLAETRARIAEQGDERSWLRHGGLAGELDRKLLSGATEAELSEVRGRWMDHVRHLRREHRLLVQQERPGFWRMVGTEDSAMVGRETYGADLDEFDLGLAEDYEDLEGGIEADSSGQTPARMGPTARALAALAEQGLMSEPLIKASVNLLIRQASESSHWHNCAHYRSLEARATIEQQSIRTAAEYQHFCRRNLRHEHVVPNSVIYKMLCAANDLSARAIEAVLTRYCIRATITLAEDQVLRDKGLSSEMPDEFRQENHELFRDPMARYKVARIPLEKRAAPLWFAARAVAS